MVGGFKFLLPNLSNLLKCFLLPPANLINTESGTEEITTVPKQNSSYPEQEAIEKNIEKYNDIPTFCFIKESYFIKKSDLIKETFVTALQKEYINLCFN